MTVLIRPTFKHSFLAKVVIGRWLPIKTLRSLHHVFFSLSYSTYELLTHSMFILYLPKMSLKNNLVIVIVTVTSCPMGKMKYMEHGGISYGRTGTAVVTWAVMYMLWSSSLGQAVHLFIFSWSCTLALSPLKCPSTRRHSWKALLSLILSLIHPGLCSLFLSLSVYPSPLRSSLPFHLSTSPFTPSLAPSVCGPVTKAVYFVPSGSWPICCRKGLRGPSNRLEPSQSDTQPPSTPSLKHAWERIPELSLSLYPTPLL